MDHICDSHEGRYHLPLGEMERCKKWFIPGKESMSINTYVDIRMELCCVLAIIYLCYMYKIGTKACEKLYDVICNAKLLEDIKKLSPHQQTSSLESYHSVINHFASKLPAFSYVGMKCRYL